MLISVNDSFLRAKNLKEACKVSGIEDFEGTFEEKTMEIDGSDKRQDTAAAYSESEGYIADDEKRPGPTVVQKLKERVSDFDNHLTGEESLNKENSNPEVAFITPMPEEEKPGFFSGTGHEKEDSTAPTKEAQPAPEVQAGDKGFGSSELGTGYEEDVEEVVNPAVVPKYDEGVKRPFEIPGGYKSFGSSEVGTGYEEGSEGSIGH